MENTGHNASCDNRTEYNTRNKRSVTTELQQGDKEYGN